MIEEIMLKDNIGLGDIFTLRIVLINGRHDTIKSTESTNLDGPLLNLVNK